MNKFDLGKRLGIAELDNYQASLDKLLRQTLTSVVADIDKPLYELANAKSKRLRSSLVFAVVKSQDQDITDYVLNSAAAVELLHLASLVHDDIIDKADTRWGRPTIAKKYGHDTAIITGDFVFAKAMEHAASVGQTAAQIVPKAFSNMCEGQQLEIAYINNLNKSHDIHLKIIEHKTAELLKASCQIGALCAGLTTKQVNNFANFGKHFGMVFQLTDDLLDIIGDTNILGKPTGQDTKAGVYTSSVIMALNSPLANEVKGLIQAKDSAGLKQLLTESGYVYKDKQLIKSYAAKAQTSLKNTPGNKEIIKFITEFPTAFVKKTLG